MQMIFMIVSLWMSVFLLRQNFVNAVECPKTIILYESRNLLALSNCTSILGSLTIMSLDDMNTQYAIKKYQFPKLK